uniref:Uncharacterized protein n=1 Tax=Rhizophora mucronata TaxID=61149 RepID=A0A2P2LBG6_RHIMU
MQKFLVFDFFVIFGSRKIGGKGRKR